MADTPAEGDAPRAPAPRGRKARTPAADSTQAPKARTPKAKDGDTAAGKTRRAASAAKPGARKTATPRKRTPAASRASKAARGGTAGVTRKRVAVAGVVAAGVAAGVAAVLGRKKLIKASNEAIDAVTGSGKNTTDTVPPTKDGMG